MRFLITGGFGFIGGRLGMHLQKGGHHVILGSRKNRDSPCWLPEAEMVQTHWDDDGSLENVCRNVDIVVHAAGMNAQECSANPVAAMEVNGLFTARIIAAAARVGVKRFLYLSTAHVYSNPLIGTITEDTYLQNLHPYAYSHSVGELAVLGANQRGEIEGIVLRLTNSFGAPVTKEVNCWMLLVNDLCRQAVQSGKLILRSKGYQQRDFIAMGEVCRVIERMSNSKPGSGHDGIFNLGSGISWSVIKITQLIQQRCEVTMGFMPQIRFPKNGINDRYERFKYKQDRLSEMGITVASDTIEEIDKLLRFCKELE